MIRLFEIMFEIDHDITVWNNYERSFGINHEKLLAKFLQGGPGVAKWMWCPKGREGVSEIPFIRAHIENG